MRFGKCLLSALLVAIAAVLPGPASARDPFVFVMNTDDQGRDGQGLAWWLLRITTRPTDTAVSGVSLDRLNEARGAGADRWCFVGALSRSSFVSPSRQVQASIDESFAHESGDLFRFSGPFTGGNMLDAVLANYEACDGRTAPFLLITDRSPTPQIVYLYVFQEYGPFIWGRLQDNRIVVASCFECDHAEGLFYDSSRRQFTWQNLGD